ncbi:hypothetical protein BpHYR1_050562 [Brachionus plicatilis]|uniref:Uncharacterized protein n=1 Tax=Brachionus plicatilis TaxID=10195 RepID=A0A3M7PAN3_BRAPC|nr:hypothetical protein BpHYR1_050562 [Brachionus plicatilis]
MRNKFSPKIHNETDRIFISEQNIKIKKDIYEIKFTKTNKKTKFTLTYRYGCEVNQFNLIVSIDSVNCLNYAMYLHRGQRRKKKEESIIVLILNHKIIYLFDENLPPEKEIK